MFSRMLGFINRVGSLVASADVSSVSPSSERIKELFVVCVCRVRSGATLLVEHGNVENKNKLVERVSIWKMNFFLDFYAFLMFFLYWRLRMLHKNTTTVECLRLQAFWLNKIFSGCKPPISTAGDINPPLLHLFL